MQRDANWADVEALFAIDTLIDASVAREVHDAAFYAGASHARRSLLFVSNIVRGGGYGGTDTIAAAHEVADGLERAGSTEAARAVRDVARLPAGYWEDLEEFGRLKDALGDAMGLTHKCPIDVMHQAIKHFKAQS